jgi:hypothetical protein
LGREVNPILPAHWLPRVAVAVAVVGVVVVAVVVVVFPRAVSNRTWTWVSFRFSKPSRVNSRSDDSTEAGRKSSRRSGDSLFPTLRRISERISKSFDFDFDFDFGFDFGFVFAFASSLVWKREVGNDGTAAAVVVVVVVVVLDRKTLPRARPVCARAHWEGSLIVFCFLFFIFFIVDNDVDIVVDIVGGER